ncbi:MAG: hypothetical protein RL071_3983 [Pseudomonadota bacterium]|jgi:biotin carboxyl carrier protein
MSDAPTLQYDVSVGDLHQRVAVRLLRTTAQGARVYGLRVAGGAEQEIEVTRPEAVVLNLLVGDRSVEAGAVPQPDGFLVDLNGLNHEVTVVDPRQRALRQGASDGSAAIRTQMPGRVVRVLVAVGDTVEKNDPLVVVEAMKMENELRSPRAGTVKRIAVQQGDLVEAKATLIELG